MKTHQTQCTKKLLAAGVGVALLGTALSARTAQAFNLSVEGAGSFNANNYGFISTPSPMIAGELTFGLDLLSFGFVWDHNFLSYNGGGTGALNFYGGLARIGLPFGLFVDGQAGIDERDNSGSSFALGAGAGFRIPLAMVFSVSPRVSYRMLPDFGSSRSLVDIGLLFTFNPI